jgi:hypothetical protein
MGSLRRALPCRASWPSRAHAFRARLEREEAPIAQFADDPARRHLLEVSAFGELAICAVVFLAMLLLGARLFSLTYRSGRSG